MPRKKNRNKSSGRTLSFNLNQLPPEVIDHVVGHLWYNSPSLHQLSLANRLLRSIAQPYIFRCISLDGERRVAELQKLMNKTPVMGFWVMELVIVHRHLTVWHSPSFRALMGSLKAVEDVAFVDMTIVLINLWSASYLSHLDIVAFPTIRRLCFMGCHIPTSVVKLVSAGLPNLQSISMASADCVWDKGQDRYPIQIAAPHLTSLTLNYTCPSIDHILQATSIRSIEYLQILDIHFQRELQREAIKFMFTNLSPSLRTLRIKLPVESLPRAKINDETSEFESS